MDFLGIKNLTLINDILKEIEEIDFDTILIIPDTDRLILEF